MNCKEAKNIDIVSILKTMGFSPSKETPKEAWFLSPLRTETKPSFKVNKEKNVFYDFGMGSGGNLIDLLSQLLGSVKQALSFLSDNDIPFSFHQRPIASGKSESAIVINQVKDIQHFALIDYLDARNISIHAARLICKEVHYQICNKRQFSIGIENISGGCDFRNKYFKNASSPKDISLISKSKSTLIITEGLFDMLSLLTMEYSLFSRADLMVLNSTSLAERAAEYLLDYDLVELYLDRDITGFKTTEYLFEKSKNCVDRSELYQNFKDPNDWILNKLTFNIKRKPKPKLK